MDTKENLSPDLHIHSFFSYDGNEKTEAYIKKAVERGDKIIGFSEHYDFVCRLLGDTNIIDDRKPKYYNVRKKAMKTDLQAKKAIIFDKDGTLLQFIPFWVPMAKAAIRQLIGSYVQNRKILPDILIAAEKSIGIENETLLPNGILSGGTYEQAAVALNNVLKKFDIQSNITRAETETAFENNLSAGKIVPVCEDLRGKLERAKRAGKLLFLVTTDNPQITDRCLRALQIRDLFDNIYCDDGICPAKPSPYAAEEILRLYRLKNAEICMVGDTKTDMKFAKNAAITAVCLGNNEGAQSMADYVFCDAGVFLDCLLQSDVRRNK